MFFLIYFIFMAVLAAAVLWRPPVALAGILCMFGLKQWGQAQNEFFAQHSPLTNILLGIILVAALTLKFFRGRSLTSDYPPIGWLILALLAYALTSWIWCIYPEGTLAVWQESGPYVFTFIVLTPLLISDMDDLRVGLLSTLAMGSIILVLLLATTEWSQRSIVFSTITYNSRGRVDAGNPLAIAEMAGFVILIGALLNFHGLARFWQVLRWGIVAVGLVAAVRSGSRGQFIGVCISLVVFLPMSRRVRSIKGFLGTFVALVCLALIASWTLQQFGANKRWDLLAMADDYQGTRSQYARDLLARWASSNPIQWLFGLGNSASFDPMLLGSYCHIVLVEALCEEGLVGLVLFLLVLYSVFRIILRLNKLVKDFPLERTGMAAAIASLCFFQIILSFKQGSLMNVHLFMFPIILGRIEAACARQMRESFAAAPIPQDFDAGPAGEQPAPDQLSVGQPGWTI